MYIHIDESSRVFTLNTKHTSYQLRITPDGFVLRALADGVTAEEVQAKTAAPILIRTPVARMAD